MSEQEPKTERARLQVKNIGGIDQADVSLDPGVTVLAGRNATNRTSLLQAIMAGLGSNQASIKGDAEEGRVRLRFEGDTYSRQLRRREGSIVTDGDAYLDDPELADLFAFLLGSNEARRAVALEQDLRDIILRSVDTDAIEAEITQLKEERSTVDERIERRESRREELSKLRRKREELERTVSETQTELEDKRERLESRGDGSSETQETESDLEAQIALLQETESELDTVQYRLEGERESIDSLEDERDDLQAELERLRERDIETDHDLDAEIERLRRQQQDLGSELSRLQSVIQFNEEMLDGASKDIATALRGEDDTANPTDRLLESEDEVVCWTCGTPVEETEIEGTLDRLRELRKSKYSEQRTVGDELDELKDRRSEIESVRTRRGAVTENIADIEAELQRRSERVEELEDRRAELERKVEQLERTVEELETERQSEALDLQREVNKLELEADRLESQRRDTVERIEELQTQVEQAEQLEQRRADINDQLEELRTRVERIERDAVEEFNEQITTVLDILGYDNIERIWIERIETGTRHDRQGATDGGFRLHVVRSTEDGVTYEDVFEHLSESEREVTGLVFALAGYLVHDVHEVVPFVLLDSLEAIDAERIANLVEYIEGYADYLVVALLEEDAAALDSSYTRITEI